jgi:SAM-dependent methyltransferase
MTNEFLSVTETGGEPVTKDQLSRLYQRYVWAGQYCRDKDVAEFGCGTGTGLGYLKSISKSLIAADIASDVLAVARAHYGDRVDIRQFSADASPLPDSSLDALILFEAIYYLPDVDSFFREVTRILRPGGVLLLATANKDLKDFNRSPFSVTYLNPPELTSRLGALGYRTQFFGGSPVAPPSLLNNAMRMAKLIAARLHLIPKTMKGKRLLKRLVFGKLVEMPREFTEPVPFYHPPTAIDGREIDRQHQVIYCVATKE